MHTFLKLLRISHHANERRAFRGTADSKLHTFLSKSPHAHTRSGSYETADSEKGVIAHFPTISRIVQYSGSEMRLAV